MSGFSFQLLKYEIRYLLTGIKCAKVAEVGRIAENIAVFSVIDADEPGEDRDSDAIDAVCNCNFMYPIYC